MKQHHKKILKWLFIIAITLVVLWIVFYYNPNGFKCSLKEGFDITLAPTEPLQQFVKKITLTTWDTNLTNAELDGGDPNSIFQPGTNGGGPNKNRGML